jgi:WD40 repeat protein
MNAVSRRLLLAVALLVPGAEAAPPAPGGGGPPRPKPARVDRHGDPLPRGALLRLGTVRCRHAGRVTFVGFASGGRILLSAGEDRLLRAADVATGRELWRRPLDTQDASRLVVLSGDGSTLALPQLVFGESGGVLILDAITGKVRRRLADRRRAAEGKVEVLDLCILSHDGRLLVAHGSEDPVLTVWDVGTGKRLREIRAENLAALSPDGKSLAVLTRDPEQKTARLSFWDVASGKRGRTVTVPTGTGSALHFLPDGRRLLAFGPTGQSLNLIDAATGKRLQRFPVRENNGEDFGDVPDFAVSPDGKRVCVATQEGVTLWEIATGKQVAALPTVPARDERATCVAFSPDGRSLAVSAGQTVTVLDLATKRPRREVTGHSGPVHGLAFSPSGAQLLSSSEEGVAMLWDARTGKELHRLRRDPQKPPDGPAPGRPEILEDLLGVACAFAPDGRSVAALWGGGPVHLWDAASGKSLRRLRAPAPQQRLAWSADGPLASAGEDGMVRLWDPRTGKQVKQLDWGQAGAKRKELASEEQLIAGVAFSPDGKTLTAAGALLVEDRTQTVVASWEVSTGARRLRVTTPVAGPGVLGKEDLLGMAAELEMLGLSLTVSPDGNSLLLGGVTGARLLDAGTGKELRQFGGLGVLRWTAAFSPDGKLLAAGRNDGKLRIWEVASGTVLHDFPAHSAAVTAVAFSPDGKTVATGSADTTVLVWDLREALREARTLKRPPGAANLRALWEDLASKDGARAYRAITALVKAGTAGVAALRESLQGKAPAQGVGLVRALRAVEVLERVGSAEARAVLQTLARQADDATLAREAQASLTRLTRRPAAP